MADDLNINKNRPPLTTHTPEGEGTKIRGSQAKGGITPISWTAGEAQTGVAGAAGDPTLPKPTGASTPTIEEQQQMIQCFNDLDKKAGQTLALSGENLKALWELYEKIGQKEPSEETLTKIEEFYSSITPERRVSLITAALTEHAIDDEGKFTDSFKNFTSNPTSPPPPGREEETEAYSALFRLLLLLNKLSSNQRSAVFEGAQTEQKNIEAQLTEKAATTKDKGWKQFGFSLASSIFGGILSIAGPLVALNEGRTISESPLGQALTSGGRIITETVSGFGQGWVGEYYDAKLTELEKSQSRAGFNKESFISQQNNVKQSGDAATQAAEEIQRGLSSVKSNIARNV